METPTQGLTPDTTDLSKFTKEQLEGEAKRLSAEVQERTSAEWRKTAAARDVVRRAASEQIEKIMTDAKEAFNKAITDAQGIADENDVSFECPDPDELYEKTYSGAQGGWYSSNC